MSLAPEATQLDIAIRPLQQSDLPTAARGCPEREGRMTGVHHPRRARLRRLGVVVLCALAFAHSTAHAASTIVVPRDFPTIQAAVNAAAPGDTIRVDGGTYREEVIIKKDLTLRGAGAGATIIRAPATLTPYGVHLPTGRSLTAVVRIGRGAHVRASGLTVAGPIPCGVEVSGVNVVQAATLLLSDARVTDLRPDAATCPPHDAAGRGVVFGLPPHIVVDGQGGSTAYGRVTNVVVERYQRVGLVATGPLGVPPSRVTFDDNVIEGGAQIPTIQFGIHVAAGAAAQVTGNTSRGNRCAGPGCGADPITQGQGAGILVQAAPAGSRIAGNAVADNDVGIYQVASPNCCAIHENALESNRFFGIVIQNGDGATDRNTIRGGAVGIGIVADSRDTVGILRRDTIRQTSTAPVRAIECCGFTATAIVKGD